MPIIQVTNRYSDEVLAILKRYVPENFEVRILEETTDEALSDAAKDADYLLASGRIRISNTVLENASKLKMIQRTGVGLDSLDLEAIRKRNIPLYVNQAVNAESVAEHAVLLILASLRKLTLIDRNTKNGIWKKQSQGITTHELKGKMVGLIGIGAIGMRVSELLKPFGTDILYYDVHRQSPETEHRLGIQFADLGTLLKKSDIISLHCPLTDETKGMMNSQAFEQMKEGAVLINTARGGLVRTEDLMTALKTGKIAFAGLDVYETEPIPLSEDILNADNVILTPHIGGITDESFSRMMSDAVRNIVQFEKGNLDAIEAYRYL